MYASAARVSRLPQGCASATRVSRLPGATVLLSWMDGCFRDDGLSDMNGYESFLQYGGVENLPHHEGSVWCGQRPSAALDKRGAITFQKKKEDVGADRFWTQKNSKRFGVSFFAIMSKATAVRSKAEGSLRS